jgi:DNA-binding NarL/FixJ family response regulator
MSQTAQLEVKNPVCVAIVDDHDAIRFAFKAACGEFDLNFCGSSDTVAGLLKGQEKLTCDVVVLDLSLADGSTVTENVQTLTAAGTQVLVFSIADKRQHVRAALLAGAAGLVRKSQSMDELVDAIHQVAKGEIVNNTETSAAIDADAAFKEQANLSPREREVLSLYAAGFALKQVATELQISVHTAKEHIDRVRRKYAEVGRSVASKTDLLLRALEDGIIEETSN